MTLIAGVKCTDGFLVAADTAVTSGNAVYHGDKLHLYRGKGNKQYRLVIACAGYLAYARMASQQIRDAVASLPNPTIHTVREQIKEVLVEIYSTHIHPYWRINDPEDSPGFNLVIGVELDGQFEVFVSEDTALEEVGTYAFQGSGSEVAQYLGETLLRSRGNSVLTVPTATAVHLIIEVFRVAKLAGAHVGLDTQLIAMRSADSYSPFSMPSQQFTNTQSEIGIIQDNLKSALWAAFNRLSPPDPLFDTAIRNIENTLRQLKARTQEQGDNQNRFVRYSLRPTTGEWSVEYLDPNMGLPS
jgi:hypothetical protein